MTDDVEKDATDVEAVQAMTGEIFGQGGALLAPQVHGGALRVGNPGNKGGGRPKESFRRRMRRILGKSLELLERDLTAELEGRRGVLANAEGIRGAPLTRADVQKTAELAAKYGVGKEDTKEVKETAVRYVVHLPRKRSASIEPAPVAVIPAPDVAPHDKESDGLPSVEA